MKETGGPEGESWAELPKPRSLPPRPGPDSAEVSSQSQGNVFPTVGRTGYKPGTSTLRRAKTRTFYPSPRINKSINRKASTLCRVPPRRRKERCPAGTEREGGRGRAAAALPELCPPQRGTATHTPARPPRGSAAQHSDSPPSAGAAARPSAASGEQQCARELRSRPHGALPGPRPQRRRLLLSVKGSLSLWGAMKSEDSRTPTRIGRGSFPRPSRHCFCSAIKIGSDI